jgi:hypothetical protein
MSRVGSGLAESSLGWEHDITRGWDKMCLNPMLVMLGYFSKPLLPVTSPPKYYG